MKTSKFTKHIIAPGLALIALLVAGQSAVAATEEAIEQSITDGITWLAGDQLANGSWSNHTAVTCMALIKLQDRAPELGYDSPFDPDYEYSDEVLAGWQYVFGGGRTVKQEPLPVQVHGASNDDPDTNSNGYGVYFQYDDWHNVYATSLCLMALSSNGDPARPNDGGLDFDADTSIDTYGELAQEAAEWLFFAQQDVPTGQGGWDYNYIDNGIPQTWVGRSDNSHAGYAVLGLAAAQNFGVTVPDWVKSELNLWIDYIQNDANGASGYSDPDGWHNVLKTGNLLFEMTFVGDANTSPRFDHALSYIESMWQSATNDPGWGYNRFPADYQAMFTLMKGLEFSNVDLIDTDGDTVRDNDWFNQELTASPSQDFASVLVDQQNADGSWPGCNWGSAELCTTWALLTLEKISPVSDPFDVEVEKDYRYTSVCFERDNDLDGSFGEDPVEYLDGVALLIDNDGDGLIDEDGIDCDPSDTGYELPITGTDPEAYTLEAVLKKNGKILNYNPGQYYAVSTVTVTRFNESVQSVHLTILEDFEDCTTGLEPVSVLNPKTGGGSVVVVEVKDGIAYQIFDATSDAVTIETDACSGVECSATAEFDYTFEEGQDEATLLVYVKFGPGLKGLYTTLPAQCENFNSAKLEVFEEGEEEPVFVIDPADDEDANANAWLTVVEK